MIVLTVHSYNGAPATGPACTFDELGGTVGRADSNQLVLPDPDRTISRVHARVVCRAGRYAVVDNGSNPISVNGKAIGSGREHPLAAGDSVQIGGYVLKVSAASSAAASSDPFADLFGDAAMGLAAPAAAPPAPSPAPQASSPWQAPRPAPAAPAALAPGFIPADWDPFAPPPAAPPGAAPWAAPAASRSTDLLLDLPPVAADSLDALFGLSGTPAAADPLGAPAAQALRLQPNTAAHADPLQALLKPAPPAPAASRHDHASELHTPMLLPPTFDPLAGAAVPTATPSPAARPGPAGAVFSWDNPPAEGRVVTLPGMRSASAAPAQPAAPAEPVAAPLAAAPSKAAPPSATPPACTPPDSADAPALLAALLQGLDTPGLRLQQLSPATMLLLGQLLRESLRGTVELLVARSALKREMRAQMTMIVARENNPLKFSPTVEVALQHLLGPPTKGFMPPAQAVRDACDDLRAHQLAVMAGMRAALDGVLQRFDPQLLEAKIAHKAGIASLIPATRKARLWESFQDLFSQLQSEAQDDFDELFGKAFLRAYEDQLDRLQGEPGPP